MMYIRIYYIPAWFGWVELAKTDNNIDFYWSVYITQRTCATLPNIHLTTHLDLAATSISILTTFYIKMETFYIKIEIKCINLLKYNSESTNPIVLINYRCECIDLTFLAIQLLLTNRHLRLNLGLIAIKPASRWNRCDTYMNCNYLPRLVLQLAVRWTQASSW